MILISVELLEYFRKLPVYIRSAGLNQGTSDNIW